MPDAAYAEVDLSTITRSERHKLLSAERRRHVLDVFDAESLPIGLDALADGVGEREAADASDIATAVRVTLHHQHLPLLDDLGLVEYDPVARRVRAP
ncbi:hypothetical protein NDI86_11605 [Halomicroarcula sp. S3CR25-11]|uniref:DUF7344 domain-containing protein n=2 Tax=Haloarcula onubensis TaxID=2950539 RepID=A0ABU2FRA3_9EURY|nr:hypothetical protein [Halomicroarcula sp. S3CR25-11]